LWVCRLLFEIGNSTNLVNFDRIVLLDLFQVTHVVNTEHRGVLLTTEFAKLIQIAAEQVITTNNYNVVANFMFSHDKIHVADRTEFVRIISTAVVDDREAKPQLRMMITISPRLKVIDKFFVGHYK